MIPVTLMALRLPANLPESEKESAEIQRWSTPFYGDQQFALGYDDKAFKRPPGLEGRVEFWKDIYTKHSSFQGVLHDSRYVHLVYGSVDFSDLKELKETSRSQFEREKERRIEQAKKVIRDRLRSFHEPTGPEVLNERDQKLKDMFNQVDEKDKFLAASQNGRLRFQLGQSDIFAEGIRQSGQYIRQMEAIFREEGLPIELTRMVFVESSFNLKAESRVGASGIWQIMPRTGRAYLRIDSSVDERNHPLYATRASARILRQNYKMLEDWPLAVTGYNHGAYGILRLSKKLESRNIADFVDFRKGSFGFASASFYASFIAALEVEQEAEKHYGLLSMTSPILGETYRLKQSISAHQILDFFDQDLERAKKLNPHVRRKVWERKGSIFRKNRLRFDEKAMEALEKWKLKDRYFEKVSSYFPRGPHKAIA